MMNDMSNSFKHYGKIDEAEQRRLESRQKTKKRVVIISLCILILAIVAVAAVLGTRDNGDSKESRAQDDNSTITSLIKAVCDVTMFEDTCIQSLSAEAKAKQIRSSDQLFLLSMQIALSELKNSSTILSDEILSGIKDNATRAAFNDCRELVSLSIDYLNDSLASGEISVRKTGDSLKTWLSSVGTYQQTCIDGLEERNSTLKTIIESNLKNSTELVSNSLAIITWITKISNSFNLRRLLSNGEEPHWVRPRDRRLVQISSNQLKATANFTVGKDKTSKYKTITAALNDVPDKSKNRTVIYVKKGVYNENVNVGKTKWNVLIIGDGKNVTVVSGSLNFIDGTPTYSTATFAVLGKGFIARDMTFQNTAGSAKHQAVALMSDSDNSIFYNCSMDAYQDTLYAHSNRQFYRNCDIYGTIDFIFGNSASVFQNCNIFPRKPLPNQQVTITAQGKVDPNQNTGLSIQNCTFAPYGDLTGVQAYLGRPWKDYSTTVIMKSTLGAFIDPSGWLPWTGNSAPDTIFYAEFQNIGPGSSTKNRVKWKGLKTNLTYKQVDSSFSVNAFLQGSEWIPNSGIPYKLSV
ncbi:hypothetical protein ACFE04_002113 [Oxalis oulophora]